MVLTKKSAIQVPQVSLESPDPTVKKPRLVKLIVRNYRCIGSKPVEIELDDIVVLVGANNTGKSSILHAYKLAMSHGSNDAKLTLDDFPGNKIDPDNLPQVEIHTVVYDDTVGTKWVNESTGEKIVRERWVWSDVGISPTRQGWDTTISGWGKEGPWGAPNVAKSHRPEPHIVDAFDSPEEQAKEIVRLLKLELDQRLTDHKKGDDGEGSYSKLLRLIGEFRKNIVVEAQEQIASINRELTILIQQVFPKYIIDFDAKPEDALDKSLSFSKSDAQLLMGPMGEHLSSIEKQGSGARRMLLWTAIKFLAENARKTKPSDSARPHLLLIDEPEICLHPAAIRDACNALYALPAPDNKWQVMLTTHSPIFIDFSKDNTTIVRVEKESDGGIKGTTIFRPDKAKLSSDDQQNLKLLNICDPYVAEFFFGGRIVVVEGDTEYTAFSYVRSQNPNEYRDVQIIRARGKATIVSLVKVLNHFGANYSILHDSDKQKTKKGDRANPAWTNNGLILDVVRSKLTGQQARLLASVPNFEEAYFGYVATDEKPYKALQTIMADPGKQATIKDLLDALLDRSKTPPTNCVEWFHIDELAKLSETQ